MKNNKNADFLISYADKIVGIPKKGISDTQSKEFDVEDIIVKDLKNNENEISKNIELSMMEKKALDEFIKNNKMDEIGNYSKEQILKYYMQGFESVDIIKLVPNTTVGGIVFLKTQENWEQLRTEFLKKLEFAARFKLALTKHRSVSLLATLINVWHDKVESGLAEYLLTGDKAKIPVNFSIRGFKDYERFIKLLKQIDDVSNKEDSYDFSKEKNKNGKAKVEINANNVTLDNRKTEYYDSPTAIDLKDKQKKSLDFFQTIYKEEEDKVKNKL